MKIAKPTTDEMKQFQDDLLASAKEMKSGRAARTTQVVVTAASEARARIGLTQGEFAELLGVSVRTLQDWEQGRRDPTGGRADVTAGRGQASEDSAGVGDCLASSGNFDTDFLDHHLFSCGR